MWTCITGCMSNPLCFNRANDALGAEIKFKQPKIF